MPGIRRVAVVLGFGLVIVLAVELRLSRETASAGEVRATTERVVPAESFEAEKVLLLPGARRDDESLRTSVPTAAGTDESPPSGKATPHPGASLSAIVEQAGEPVSGIRVALHSSSGDDVRWADTGVDGRCRLDGVPAGVALSIRLERAEPPHESWHPHPKGVPVFCQASYPQDRLWQSIPGTLTLRPGEAREETYVLESLCSIEGSVRETDGRPASGITVGLLRDDDGLRQGPFSFAWDGTADQLHADQQGRFRVEGLPSGVWWIGPIVEGWREGADPLLPAGLATHIVLREDAEPAAVELLVHRGLFIEGTVTGPQGEEVANPLVWALEFEEYAEVDDRGTFRFGPLVPGEYHLYAEASACETPVAVVAQAGDRGVRLELAFPPAENLGQGK
jgi:hypothetical protein